MGADQHAVEVGRGLGVKDGQAITYSKGKSREAMRATSMNIRGCRTAKLTDADAVMSDSLPNNAQSWRTTFKRDLGMPGGSASRLCLGIFGTRARVWMFN
ncbi:hypothetical protein [Mycolicibacter arupensis]|uniref:hypothetical protein n=1 Tax=Mycolicibacter arupensis TaxID=342002 RepID=UPI0023F3FFC3|nr:hypothetical protein [Mycolicibacter arupensis]